RCNRGPAGSPALHLDAATGGFQLFLSLARDQGAIRRAHQPWRAIVAAAAEEGRTGHLATAFLGARGPRRTGLRALCGLHPLEPGQAWTRTPSAGLAAFEFSPLRRTRCLFEEFGRRIQ